MLNHLSVYRIAGTGTLRANHTDHFRLKDLKVIGKDDRGSYDYRCDSANKVIVVRWNDNNVVTLASSCQPVNSLGTTKHYSIKDKKIVDVPEPPPLLRFYNKNIGGVDRMDQNIS